MMQKTRGLGPMSILTAAVVAVVVTFAVIWGFTSSSRNDSTNMAFVEDATSIEQLQTSATPVAKQRPTTIASIPAADFVDESQEGKTYEAGQVIVTFDGDQLDTQTLASLQNAVTLDVSDASAVDIIAQGIAVVPVREGATVAQAVQELSWDENIKSAEVNAYVELFEGDAEEFASALAAAKNQITIQEGIDAASLFSLSIDDPDADKQWALSDANANMYDIWEQYVGYTDASGEAVVVAVIDSGIVADHPDLENNIVYP